MSEKAQKTKEVGMKEGAGMLKEENLCRFWTFHVFVVELEVIAWFHWNKLGPVY